MRQGNGNKFRPEQNPPLLMASASVIGAHRGMPILSWLRACGPVIPGIPRLAGDDPAGYPSGRYGDQVRYGDGILFLFVGGLMHLPHRKVAGLVLLVLFTTWLLAIWIPDYANT